MLKMALNAFWHNGFNIWKMTPADPPPPPTYGIFHMFNGFFLKLPLVTYKITHYVIYKKE